MLSIQCIHAHTSNNLNPGQPSSSRLLSTPCQTGEQEVQTALPSSSWLPSACHRPREAAWEPGAFAEDLGGLFLVRSAGLLRGRILILKLSRLLGVGSGGHMAVEGFRVSVLKGKPGALSVWVVALYLLSPHALDGCASGYFLNVP